MCADMPGFCKPSHNCQDIAAQPNDNHTEALHIEHSPFNRHSLMITIQLLSQASHNSSSKKACTQIDCKQC